MKQFFILFLTFFILGCSGGGGGDEAAPATTPPPVTEPPVVADPLLVTFFQTHAVTTQLPLLVILVDFDDYAITDTDLAWSQKIFSDSQGQLNHYFKEISGNTFSFIPANEGSNTENDGIIKVHLNFNHPNSGSSNFDNIADPALALADASIDFASYDTNMNNKIDVDELQIMFLVAGGENATGLTPGIWAHTSCIDGIAYDGTSLMQCSNGSYTSFGERHFSFGPGGNDASIGIIAHELGHGAFYLPDLYDTDQSSVGIGNFGLMGSGSWTLQSGEFPGETPSHMCAWTKIQSGFLVQDTISTDVNNLPLNATGTTSYEAIKINTQDSNEYFLVENRSALGYDSGLYRLELTTFQGGLAVWHIDESQSNNADENQRLVDLEEADGFLLNGAADEGDQTNLFYAGNNAAAYTGVFTPNSTPSNSDLYNNSDTNIYITNISAAGSIMYLDLSF